MPSIFSRAGGSRKDKRPPPLNASTLPTRNSSTGIASARPDSAGFRKVNGFRQEVGEFGTSSGQHTPQNQTLPSTHGISLPCTPPISPRPGSPPPSLPPKYSFLPTHIPSETPSNNSIDSFAYSTDEVTSLRRYGVLGEAGSKLILGLEDVGKVIREVGRELEKRGLTTPWLFSNQALELSQPRVKRLINSYIESIGARTLNRSTRSATIRPGSFQQDLQFAKEHELAWLLRWAMSRITRLKEGSREVCHGVLEWDIYEEWRGRERAAHYPVDAFPYLSALIPSDLYHQVLTPLFQLLSRFAANSHLSGLTPQALSSLFAPLLFDIPTSAPALAAHATFVRAASASEHLLLAFIRSQSSSKSELGVKDLPTRLREWVIGYPSMLASDADLARGTPRKGAKIIRCERASRLVRAYTRDLVGHAELWAADLPNDQKWDQWDRVILQHRKGDESRPKFSQAWRRKMAIKESLPLPASASDSLERHTTYGKARAPGRKEEKRERKKSDEEEGRYGSLAGKEWTLFEEGGFDSPNEREKSDMKSRLQFDLTESAKNTVSEKRQTMDWSEFASSSGGFSRTDPHLAVSLTFSEPLANSITSWPSEREALQRKLHKSQKDSTPFQYDTSIKLGLDVENDQGETRDEGGRVWIEEAFVDCWTDLMLGAGWTERDELTYKEANWALVEYKAKPSRIDLPSHDPLADPRTSDILILFEERVPLQYQMAIANPQQKKTFAGLFSSRPRGRVPQSQMHPSLARRKGEDQDFDRMLMARSATKKVTLGQAKESSSIWHREPPISPLKVPLPPSRTVSGQSTPTEAMPRKRTKSSNSRQYVIDDADGNKTSFFSKNRVARRVKTNEDNRARAREHEVDFEIHSASGLSSGGTSPQEGDNLGKKKSKKGGDDDEKWMDILIANGARRMDRQDAVPPKALAPLGASAGSPSSPRPLPRRPQSPSHPVKHNGFRPHTHEYQDAHHQHTPELTRDRSTDDEAQLLAPATPRASGFSQSQSQSSPRSSEDQSQVDPYAHGLASRHQGPGHDITYSYSESDDEPRYSTDAPSSGEFTTRTSGETTTTDDRHLRDQGSAQRLGRERLRNDLEDQDRRSQPDHSAPQPHDQREIPIVAPIPTRDTIHGIVSQYAQRHSMVSYDSRYDDDSQASISIPNTSPMSRRTANAKLSEDKGADTEEEAEREDQLQELKSPLHPPPPTFDLTPGREPSPMRYKHGEPLQFVGEEDETLSH